MKYAVRYLKNTYYPLDTTENVNLQDGQMVIVRTEKGEEALKVFIVNCRCQIFNTLYQILAVTAGITNGK